MAALTEVVRQGKARYVGFSEWTPEQIEAALAIPGVERFVSSQPQYSILRRRIEAEVVPLCEANGISQIVWSPLAQGVLTGKYRSADDVPPDSRAASEQMGWSIDSFLEPRVLAAVQGLRPIADGLGITMAQLALAWVLRQPNVALGHRRRQPAGAGGPERRSLRDRARRRDTHRDRRGRGRRRRAVARLRI